MPMHELVLESKIYPHIKIFASYDELTESPMEYIDTDIFQLVCWHRKYKLGTLQPKQSSREYFDQLMHEFKESGTKYSILNLYLMDHGCTSISLNSFNDPWDSGQVGFLTINQNKAKEMFGDEWETRAKEAAEAIVKEYDEYLRGEVYVVYAYINGNCEDSLGGIYKSMLTKYAKEMLEEWEKEESEKNQEQFSYVMTFV